MKKKKEFYEVEAIKAAAAYFGSMSKLSLAIKATYGSVFKWAHGHAVPSPLNCMRIEKATKGHVKKEQIRPHFDWDNFTLI